MENASMQLANGTILALAGQMTVPGEPACFKDFECPICHNHTFDNMAFTVCEHVFHQQCIDDAIERNPECPTCRKPLPAGEERFKELPRPTRRMFNGVKVPCPQGCGDEREYETLRGHIEDSCVNTPFRCDSEGCGQVFPRGAAIEHSRECLHMFVDCDQECGEKVKRGELQRHKDAECTHRKVRCPHCHQEGVVFCKTDEHLKECTGTALVKDIEQLKGMFAQMQQVIADQQQQIVKLEGQVVKLEERDNAQQREIGALQQVIADQQQQIVKLEGQVVKLEERDNAQQREIGALQQVIADQQQTIVKLSRWVVKLKARDDAQQREIDALRRDRDSLRSSVTDVDRRCDSLKRECNSLDTRCDELREKDELIGNMVLGLGNHLNAPVCVRVTSGEKSNTNGLYILQAEKGYGHRVWKSIDEYYMFTDQCGGLVITNSREAYMKDLGVLKNNAHGGSKSPICSSGWEQAWTNPGWGPAPRTKVEEVTCF
eukprot:TRINITY_DN1677_c0_g1_i1.p1 TRINITY_DN1677_c0_g1~~TRINITY_DN1677_c0_g1_i1.p1  ORF type:complete len:488 (+),score=157.03 TRINITY_DN1677_c0_g1_i1:103-1566(+)